MVLGLSARVEGEEMKVKADGFSGGDRTSLDLPAPQEQLLERVHAAGKTDGTDFDQTAAR